MENKIVIAIDAMGGEDSPGMTIAGLKLFLKKNSKKNDFFFYLYGDESLIRKELVKQNIKSLNLKIFHTQTTVSDEETPLTAVKNSKNSSMWNSINSQIVEGANISLSAGNTGVLFVISRMILKTIDQVSKPALAGLWPSKKGMNVVLDLGANVECNDSNLVDFTEMGSALFKSLFPNETPKVSLLNIGSEEIKGTETLKKSIFKVKRNKQIWRFYFQGLYRGK